MEKSNFKTYIKALAFILSVLMAFYAVPTIVFADAVEAIENALSSSEEASATVENVSTTEEERIYEEIGLREESVKHFRLEDGSYIAAQYSQPVHIKDADGEWQDIDNTLSDSGSDFSTSNARVKFAKKTTGNNVLFTLHDGNYKIEMALEGANKKVDGQVTNTNTEFDETATELQKMMTLDKLSSRILYPDILDGVDLEYVIDSLNIKENIIVKDKQDSYSYTFTLKLNNLEAELQADGSILVFDPDTDAVVYTIPAPIVYDANYVYANADQAEYTLTDNGNGKYTLTVTVDSSWMNAEDRVFPVVVDPAIYTSTSNMIDTYIDSANASTSHGSNATMNVGHESSTREYISYWKATTLPAVPAYAYISSVELELCTTTHYPFTQSPTVMLALYNAQSSWDGTLTWGQYSAGNKGQIGTIIDCITTSYLNDGFYVGWDITALAKQWYDGTVTNNGVVIRAASEDLTYVALGTSEATVRPYFTVKYYDAKGIESYWTFLSQSAGGAGNSAVNVATGNLVFSLGTLSTMDGLFGYTPTLVYNSSNSANAHIATETHNALHQNRSAGIGWKWNFNETIIKKTYTNKEGTTAYYYLWIDSDGTEHAFYPDGNSTTVFKDEDGLMLTLQVVSDGYTIKDSAHNTRHFLQYVSNYYVNEGGVLDKITDKFGNELIFTLDSNTSGSNDDGLVKSISIIPKNQSTEIPYLSFTYNSNGVSEVKNDTTGHKVTFEYTNINVIDEWGYTNTRSALTKATFARTVGTTTTTYSVAEYTYAANTGKLITASDTTSGTKLVYEYDANGRISTITEQAGTSTGQSIGFEYGIGTTAVQASGNNDTYGDTDDIVNHYTFDNAGRTISAYSTNIYGNEIYGASSGVYGDENNEGEAKNSLKNTAVTGGTAINYLLNPGFEIASSNSASHWVFYGNVTATLGEVSNVAYVRPSADSPNTLTQYVRLNDGIYTLSMECVTNQCANVSMTIMVKTISNNTTIASKEIPVSELYVDSSITPNLTFEVDGTSGYENLAIVISVVGESGCSQNASVSIDNVMLESGNGSSGCNVVAYGSFGETAVNSSGSMLSQRASYWIRSDTTYVTFADISPLFGTGLQIVGNLSHNYNAYQSINITPQSVWSLYKQSENNIPASMVRARFFMFSAMAKGSNQVASGEFGFKVVITPFEGATREIFFPCNPYVTEAQYISGLIPINDGEMIKNITVYCVYNGNPGTAFFDNISITETDDSSAAEYTYNGAGYVETVVTPKTSTYYAYDSNGNCILEASIDGYYSAHEYNGANALASTETGTLNFTGIKCLEALINQEYTPKTNLIVNYSYNDYGLLTSTTTTTQSSTQSVVVSNTYEIDPTSKLFGRLLSTTNENGDTTSYVYDETTGLLTYQLSADGSSGLYYTYDTIGRLIEVVPLAYSPSVDSYYGLTGAEKAAYTYNAKKQLEKITTDSTEYTFTYDAFGNTTQIKAGNYILVSYTYAANNGKLSTMTYGNNDKVTYFYDTLDRIDKICYNDTTRFVYQYTSDGKLHSVEDIASDIGYLYSYDSQGRLEGYTEYKLSDDTNILALNYQYDEKSRLDMLLITHDYPVGTGASTGYWYESYYYQVDTDLLNNYEAIFDVAGTSNDQGIEIAYEYDDLQVLKKKTLSVMGSACQNIVEYGYEVNGTNRGSQIASYSSQMGSATATTYTFTYDQKGNITNIEDSVSGIVRYFYDDLGQLIREDNPYMDKSYVYTYDNNGNRISKKTYSYPTENTLGAAIATETYTYGDSTWGDRLTAYNGTSITYDTIGNPESYYNGFYFTWEDGRRLAYATLGMDSYSFTYNDEGIRTSKTYNNSVTHKYTLDGSRIISEQWGNHFIAYLYDETGAPIGMQYRTSSYAEDVFDTFYFEKNLQGDIVAIYNASGVKLITYQYDAWGNHTATYSNGGGSTGAQYNPFRYRGYYYDTDLGLYYLNSRYYDSNTGRFLNADGQLNDGILGYNQFAYCENNPIMYIDINGTDAIYAVDYFPMVFVGHAFLYVQDANGVWYKTQFATTRKILRKKYATVYSIKIGSDEDLFRELAQKNAKGFFAFFYLEGDYSNSINEAMQIEDSEDNGYNGKYDFFTNNCLHYVKHILRFGNNVHDEIDDFIKNTDEIVPDLFYKGLLSTRITMHDLKSKYASANKYSSNYSNTTSSVPLITMQY